VLGSCTSSIDVAKCNGVSSLEDHSHADLTVLEKDSASAVFLKYSQISVRVIFK